MLEASFQHLRGIGERTERDLWRRGVLSWDELEARLERQLSLFRSSRANAVAETLRLSRSALESRDAQFFARLLPRREHYRIALAFPEETVFLDIETTGLSHYYDHITMVGWGRGSEYDAFIRGRDDRAFRRVLAEAKVLVTFNGAIFDLPFIRKEFPEVSLPAAHVDLRFLVRRVGLGGGQKGVEELLGLRREGPLARMEGSSAPLLWHRYVRGDREAGRILAAYNRADVEGLKYIFDRVVRQLLSLAAPRALHPSGLLFPPSSTSLGDERLRAMIDVPPAVPGPKRISISDLAKLEPLSSLRVVGIDLTGSERRPSGWCLLHGNNTTSRLVSTDAEILEITSAAGPTLVSIDSPLSLPAGRTRVTDDDPQRAIHGITRLCERTLRQRGINVYPCLIPSMQALTDRGMRLATELRRRGIPVIESYPGAAQDMLGIPRKRASLELLHAGLVDFGLQGEWVDPVTAAVSHDELDAITAAVVGVFFWVGMFEALGDEDEGVLIVPDLRADPHRWLDRQVLGLSGPIAAGKTTGSLVLADGGCAYTRFSLVLEELLRTRGEDVTRSSLQTMGSEINAYPGQRWLCRRVMRRVHEAKRIVIDGLRHPEDHAYLVEHYGPAFRHVYVDAPEPVRRDRYLTMGYSVADYVGASGHQIEASVQRLQGHAHARVLNDYTIDSFRSNVVDAARSHRSG